MEEWQFKEDFKYFGYDKATGDYKFSPVYCSKILPSSLSMAINN